jgi:hypothetical protein
MEVFDLNFVLQKNYQLVLWYLEYLESLIYFFIDTLKIKVNWRNIKYLSE